MPSFDFFCPANGQTVEVMLKLHESLTTWGELCARKGIDPGDTPADAPIEKRFTSAVVMDKSKMGSGVAPVNMGYTGKSASYNV
jgi:hypothetical protein